MVGPIVAGMAYSAVVIALSFLRPNGIIAAYASMGAPQPTLQYYPLMFNNTLIRLVFVYAMPDEAKRVAGLAIDEMLRNGTLRPRVAETFALEKIAEAHETVEAGRQIGNVIVKI